MSMTETTEIERKELGELTDMDAVDALILLEGLTLVDVGCGPGRVSLDLCARGANVLGVEPDPLQAEKNRHVEPAPGLTFAEAGAEALPVETGSIDGVFFFRSLHHVPKAHKEAALAEAARVLKPGTGFLWIVEPAIDGTHHHMMKPFHDETIVLKEAQAALSRMASGLFGEMAAYRYVQRRAYPDFETMVTRFAGNTYNDISRESVETDEVRALFEAGRTSAGEYVFDQPMLLNLYRRPH